AVDAASLVVFMDETSQVMMGFACDARLHGTTRTPIGVVRSDRASLEKFLQRTQRCAHRPDALRGVAIVPGSARHSNTRNNAAATSCARGAAGVWTPSSLVGSAARQVAELLLAEGCRLDIEQPERGTAV